MHAPLKYKEIRNIDGIQVHFMAEATNLNQNFHVIVLYAHLYQHINETFEAPLIASQIDQTHTIRRGQLCEPEP